MNKKSILNNILLLSVFTFGLLCVNIDPTNPQHDEYEGKYEYEIDWTALPDTLEIFTPYSIPFLSKGEDFYAGIGIFDSIGVNFCDTVHFTFNDSDSVITLYFSDIYSGILNFGAIRPNGMIDLSPPTKSIEVINPYTSNVSDVVGVNSVNEVKAKKTYNTDSFPDSIKMVWEIGDSTYVLLWEDSPYATMPFTSGILDLDYKAYVSDKFNQRYLIDSKTIEVNGNAPIIENVFCDSSINLGDTISVSLIVNDADQLDSFKVSIYTSTTTLSPDSMNWLPTDSTLKTIKLAKPITDTGKIKISAVATDYTSSLLSNVAHREITVNYKLPSPSFSDTTLYVNSEDSSVISFIDNNYEKGTVYHWFIPEMGIDDTLESNSLKLQFADTSIVNLSVIGINKFGYSGNVAKLKIIPMKFDYTVDMKDVFDTLASNNYYTFSATVKNSIGSSVPTGVTYFWGIVGDSAIIDTAYQENEKYTLKVKDESGPFQVKVHAIVNIGEKIDTTNTVFHNVSIDKKPIVNFSQDSIFVLLGDSLRCTLNVSDDGYIDSVFILIDDSLHLMDTTEVKGKYYYSLWIDTIKLSTISFWAIDNEKNSSDTTSVIYRIFSNEPSFSSIFDSNTVYIYDTVNINLPSVYSGNNLTGIKEFLWDTTGDGEFDISTSDSSLTFIKNVAFDDSITVAAVNFYGDTSIEYFNYHLVVDVGIPLIKEFKIDSLSNNNVFIKEKINITLWAFDANKSGLIDSLFIDSDGDGIADITFYDGTSQSVTKNPSLSFIEGGKYLLSAWVKDDHGNLSEIAILKDTIFVDQGTPRIDSLSKPSEIYINDTLQYTIHAFDTNGTIENYYWSLDSINFDSLGDTNSFNHAFDSSGLHKIYLKIVDNDLNSVFKTESIYVDLGKPSADSIVGSSSIWVNDSYNYSFYYHDVNDSLDSIYINWGDDAVFYVYNANENGDTTFAHTYPISNDTNYVITLIVKDNDGIMDTCFDTVTVQLGKPIIDTISINVDLDTIFVNDTITYRLNAHDLNDDIRVVYVSWDGDEVADDSIISLSQNADISFKHSYDTTQSGIQNIRFWVDDSDFIKSKDTVITINVREGRPLIWGDSGDTLIVIINNGAGQNYPISPNYMDTNSVIKTFYWSNTPDNFADSVKTTVDFILREFDVNDMNKTIPKWIAIQDNDGYIASKMFTILADSVPPIPELFIEEEIGDSIVLKWAAVKDYLDGEDTEIKIMIKYGTTGDPDITIQEYTSFSNFNTENIAGDDYLLFGFKPLQTSTWIRWQVFLKDKRGSESKSAIRPYYFN